MKQKIFTLFARTPIHVGAGNSVGAIDSPITRERHTRIPILPGSALKGVLADFWLDEADSAEHDRMFGTQERSGRLFFGEARTLAFPLRSAKGAFAWITCPLALLRFQRDSGKSLSVPVLPDTMSCLAGNAVLFEGGKTVLEEYVLTQIPNATEDLKKISSLLLELSDDPVWSEITDHLVIVSDEMFSYFVENACEVVTRIRINDATGTVDNGALFNQEQVPSETLLYTAISARKEDDDLFEILARKLGENGNQLQIGGDETIGLGVCSVKLM
ncbi:MAG: type III-B CRISPR module RAMP protein Cmr4 [Lentisphaeria bacterium]|nr:type III-B CRISPR module RAMP protein Cmr4 [Lentisphaeria bacterium]